MKEKYIVVPMGWCATCNTNDCGHLATMNEALMDSFQVTLNDAKQEGVTLPGLTAKEQNT